MEAQELRDRDSTLTASRRIAEDLRKARFHYGPFYLLSSIQLSDIGYDQQFFVPTSDTSTGFNFGLAMPNRLYFTPNRKVYFSVDATPEWSRFRGTTTTVSRNQYGYKSRADVQFLFNHLYLDTYAIRNDDLRADSAELSALVTRKVDEIGAAGEVKYSSRTSLTYSAVQHGERFPIGGDRHQPANLPVNLLDRSDHSYRAALIHKTFPLTSLLIAGEYSGYSFSNAVYKNSHRTYAGAGVIYDSGRTMSRLEAGYARLNFIRPDQKDFRGTIGNFTVDHRLSDRWRLGGNLARDLNFSIFADNNYYVVTRAAASTEYSLTRRVSVNAGMTAAHDDYDIPSTGAKSGGLERRHDRITFPSVGWTYSSAHWFRGGFDVGYLKRTSNFPVSESNGIRVIVRLSLTP